MELRDAKCAEPTPPETEVQTSSLYSIWFGVDLDRCIFDLSTIAVLPILWIAYIENPIDLELLTQGFRPQFRAIFSVSEHPKRMIQQCSPCGAPNSGGRV